MSAKNIGQSQIIFVTTANADLLYVKPRARKPSFPGPVTPVPGLLLLLPLNSRVEKKILHLPEKVAHHP